MDTSIYIGKVIKLLPQTVDIWINAQLSRKKMEGKSSKYRLFGRYSFQASSYVGYTTC